MAMVPANSLRRLFLLVEVLGNSRNFHCPKHQISHGRLLFVLMLGHVTMTDCVFPYNRAGFPSSDYCCSESSRIAVIHLDLVCFAIFLDFVTAQWVES